jgi:thiamine biosynthesis lipoprotein
MHTTSIALLVTLATGPGRAVVTETRPMMGSVVTVTVVAPDAAGAAPGIEAAFARFARVDAVMNEWRPESPLSRLNAASGRGWIRLPADLCEVLRIAKDGAEATAGRFDPTWAALSDLWRFDGAPRVPDPNEVRRRCPLVDHAGLRLRPRRDGGCDARLLRRGMRVGLGGIAKGWAVDEAAKALRAIGFRDFLLQAGGDLYAAGRRGDTPWRIAIRDPDAPQSEGLAALDVSDRAFSTSGDDEHGFVADGRRYHHVIDPRTCVPAPATRAVTVLAPTAVRAEIATKAAFVEGGVGGLALAGSLGVEAVIVTASGEVLASSGIGPRLIRGTRPIRTVDPPPRVGAAPRNHAPAPSWR